MLLLLLSLLLRLLQIIMLLLPATYVSGHKRYCHALILLAASNDIIQRKKMRIILLAGPRTRRAGTSRSSATPTLFRTIPMMPA